jgi:hypothetical protein
MFSAQAVIGAQSPPLHQRENPVNRNRQLEAALSPTPRWRF